MGIFIKIELIEMNYRIKRLFDKVDKYAEKASAFCLWNFCSANLLGSFFDPISELKLALFASRLSKPPSCKFFPLGPPASTYWLFTYVGAVPTLLDPPSLLPEDPRCPPVLSGYEEPAPNFFSSAQSSSAIRASASRAGSRRLAPEVFSLANVEFDPDTPRGSLLRFSEKSPPSRDDSAARESEATAPAPSWI